MPKPSTVRKMPSSRRCSIRRTISASVLTPTLKSPSVARMTRLLPSEMKCSLRDVVGELDPGAAGGRAARLQPVDRLAGSSVLSAPLRRRQHQARRAGVDDDGHPVLLAKLLHQRAERLLDQRQLVGRLHRARDVDQEHEVARRQVSGRDATRPGGRSGRAGAPAPRGTTPTSVVHGERVRPLRSGIAIGEVVDQLLDPDRVLRRQRALAQEAADVAVRGRVHVDREGRRAGSMSARGTGSRSRHCTPRC